MLKKLFLNNNVILGLVFANAVVIILQESGFESSTILSFLDQFITILFVIECIIKISTYGFPKYISDGWNKLDFILTIISLPSLLTIIFPEVSNLSVVLTLRILRVFKFFRVIKFFPNIDKLARGVKLAFRDSAPVFAGFIVMIIIFALLSCSLFKIYCPEYFADPISSIYTTFKLFTVEGWYEIPETVAETLGGGIAGSIVKFYFSFLLIVGGIFGLSIVNSVFVDSMVADNNDELEEKINSLNKKIDELSQLVKELKDNKKE